MQSQEPSDPADATAPATEYSSRSGGYVLALFAAILVIVIIAGAMLH
jgi:hypothetical protein